MGGLKREKEGWRLVVLREGGRWIILREGKKEGGSGLERRKVGGLEKRKKGGTWVVLREGRREEGG